MKEKLKAFESEWSRGQGEDPGWPTDPEDQEYHQYFLEWMDFHEAMLIGELVAETRKYLLRNPRSEHRTSFKHVLVDEYQDLNRADQELIQLIGGSASIVVVGDEDQSIYGGLRHAQPEGIRDYAAEHPGTQSLELSDCRRCPKQVVAMANSLIHRNNDREDRSLSEHESNSDEDVVSVIQWETKEEEALGIAGHVSSLIADPGRKVSPQDIMILVPRRDVGYSIKHQLDILGVPSQTEYPEDALKTDLARRRFSYLNLLAKPDDRVALRVALGSDRKDKSVTGYYRLREYCEATESDPFKVMARVANGTTVIPQVEKLKRAWIDMNEFIEQSDALAGQELVDLLFSDSTKDLGPLRRLALDVLESAASQGVEVNAEYLYQRMLLGLNTIEVGDGKGYVQIMTLFQCKGLTGKFVMIAGVVQGWVPSIDSTLKGIKRRRHLEEQRRLFYVAITRCTEEMVISSFRSMPVYEANSLKVVFNASSGGRARVQASQFLDELGNRAPQAKIGL